MSCELVYNPIYEVVVCKQCQSCVIPGAASIQRHLRANPHRLLCHVLKAHLDYTNALDLRSLEELRETKPAGRCPALQHLRVYNGYLCLLCNTFLTTNLSLIQRHMSIHNKKAQHHGTNPLWQDLPATDLLYSWEPG